MKNYGILPIVLSSDLRAFMNDNGISIISETNYRMMADKNFIAKNIRFMQLGKQFEVIVQNEEELFAFMSRLINPFANCTNIPSIDLPLMKDYTEQELDHILAKKKIEIDRLAAKNRFLEWLISEPYKAEQVGLFESENFYDLEYFIGGVKIGIEDLQISISVEGEKGKRYFFYEDYNRAIGCIIDAYEQLDEKSIYHRIFK